MMISKIQKDFLLLFQCIIDFGAEVLRDFTEEKIKIKYKTDDFTTFLENTKHYFYHQWDKKKVVCCECPAHGCSIPKTGKMDKKIYDKLYLYNSSMKHSKGHEKKSGSSVIQTCICRYTAKHILINALDLSDLNALLIGLRSLNTPMICHSEAILINEIMNVRGTVCHAVTTTTFSEPELNNLWAKFTNALYNLFPGGPQNVKWLKKTIETTKKTILSDEDVQELMGKIDIQAMDVQDISEEVKKIMIDTTADLKKCVLNESVGIKAHFDNQIKKSEERIIGRLEHILGSHPVIARAFLSEIRTEPVIERADKRKIAIKGKITQASMTKTNEDNVIRTLPAEIDVTYENIEKPNEKRQMMHINATKANSIELELEVTAGIFENAETMRMAILTLVKEVIVAAKADASKEDPINILLTFESPLTEAETVTVTDFFMNTHQNGNQSQGDIVATIDASSSGSTASYPESGNTDETVTVTDLVMNTNQNGNQSQSVNSSGSTASYLEVGNAESSILKDPIASIFSKKNETINYLEKLQGLEKKAEEVTRLLLDKHVTRGKNISSLLMKHRHSIYHLYDRNPCCQCSAVIPKESGVRSLRKNEFEGMFAKKRVKCQYSQRQSTCICFWNARKDVNELCLPFPVIIYLLDYSSVTNNYERQLNRMKSTLVQINKLGQRLEMIDFYKIWKSLGDDILYMANAISTQYRETTDIDIQAFRPNLSTFELSVLDFMNDMNITITDGLSKFQTEMTILRKDMEAHIFERNHPVRDVATNASSVQAFRTDFGNQILDLRRYIGTEVQDLKADIDSLRKIQDSKEMAETQKPLTKVLIEKHEELQYEKQNYKSPYMSAEPHVPLKERQLLKSASSKQLTSERTTEMEGKSIDELPGEKHSCYSCQQKDNQMKKLEKNNSKLKERVWTLNRFVYEKDLETLEVNSNEDSDYVSIQLSEEVLEEEHAKSSESVTLQSSASTTTTSTNPEKMEYYTRFAYVISTVAQDIFRDIMRSAISVEQLYGLSNQFMHNFSCKQQLDLKEMRLSNSYAALDLSFLYKVFRQFSLIPPPTKGWGMMPAREDICISDDVERLRFFRNHLAHRGKRLIRRLEFNENFSQLLEIGRRVDMYLEQKTSYEQRIMKSMKDDMNSENYSGYEHALHDLELIQERLESKPIKFFWGDSFESSLRSLKQMIKEQTMDGKKKHHVQIVINSQQEVEQSIGGILHSLQEEMSEGLTGIEFILCSKE